MMENSGMAAIGISDSKIVAPRKFLQDLLSATN